MQDNIVMSVEELKIQLEIMKFKREIEKEEKEDRAKLQQKKNKVRLDLKEKGKLTNGEVNEYDNYQYFSEAQYKELFTDLFSKHGIDVKINEIDYGTFEGTDKQPYGRTVTLACTLIDMETGYEETTNHTGEGLDRGDKAGYKATTGALKRFLSSTFLVATQDDPEREDKKPEKTPYKKAPVDNKKTTETKKLLSENQKKLIDKLFENDKESLDKVLKRLKVKTKEELSINDASRIIKLRQEGRI